MRLADGGKYVTSVPARRLQPQISDDGGLLRDAVGRAGNASSSLGRNEKARVEAERSSGGKLDFIAASSRSAL